MKLVVGVQGSDIKMREERNIKFLSRYLHHIELVGIF